MSKLIHLWVRQALVRRMTGKTRGTEWPMRSMLLEPPGPLDEGAPVIEQNDRSDGAARISGRI
jgi:hypothetical protein